MNWQHEGSNDGKFRLYGFIEMGCNFLTRVLFGLGGLKCVSVCLGLKLQRYTFNVK